MYYLLTYKSNFTENDKFYVVESQLDVGLTCRLLTFLVDADMRVYGTVQPSAVTWLSAERPDNIVRIGFFIEPTMFTSNGNKDKNWLLLNRDEAKKLWQEYMQDPRYLEIQTASKHNYFKNSVDMFKDTMERKWSK